MVMMMTSVPLALQASSSVARVSRSPRSRAWTSAEAPARDLGLGVRAMGKEQGRPPRRPAARASVHERRAP